MAETTLTVNGQAYTVPVDSADESVMLLWVLREDLGLTGTKFGCGLAECGACTVHYDGEPIRACITPIGRVLDGDITTVEGLPPKTAPFTQCKRRGLNSASRNAVTARVAR
ncbi:MAG: 2Fe-2S iron-sulfur cluster-binding protein [Thermomicrobiales bacterium]